MGFCRVQNTLFRLNELTYTPCPLQIVFWFMNFANNERPLARNQLRLFKRCLPCQQKIESVIHSLNFSVVLNVEKMTLSVLCAMDPVCQVYAPQPILVLAAIAQRDN
jgi:hypothetical protein